MKYLKIHMLHFNFHLPESYNNYILEITILAPGNTLFFVDIS